MKRATLLPPSQKQLLSPSPQPPEKAPRVVPAPLKNILETNTVKPLRVVPGPHKTVPATHAVQPPRVVTKPPPTTLPVKHVTQRTPLPRRRYTKNKQHVPPRLRHRYNNRLQQRRSPNYLAQTAIPTSKYHHHIMALQTTPVQKQRQGPCKNYCEAQRQPYGNEA